MRVFVSGPRTNTMQMHSGRLSLLMLEMHTSPYVKAVISRPAGRTAFGGDACVSTPEYYYQFDENRAGVIVPMTWFWDLRGKGVRR